MLLCVVTWLACVCGPILGVRVLGSSRVQKLYEWTLLLVGCLHFGLVPEHASLMLAQGCKGAPVPGSWLSAVFTVVLWFYTCCTTLPRGNLSCHVGMYCCQVPSLSWGLAL
jgi:hypothetical protein